MAGQRDQGESGDAAVASSLARRRSLRLISAAVLVLIVGAIVVVAFIAAPGPTKGVAAAGPTVSVSTDTCGSGWSGHDAGQQSFTLQNTTVAGVETYLQDPVSRATYLDVEGLGTTASVDVNLVLNAGDYQFVCLPADADPVLGPVFSLGPDHEGRTLFANATPGIVPVTRNDMIPIAKQYGAWITAQLPALLVDTQLLQSDIVAGNLTAARSDWLTAHLAYEQLGAAYGAFGDLDSAINGMPASGSTALTDPGLTGFHRIEALLYSTAAATDITGPTGQLVASVSDLQTAFASARIDPLDVGLRAHEILENALQFELSGRTDANSGTELATVSANLTGTNAALAPLRPLLATRYPPAALADTDAALSAAETLVTSYRHADGTWTPLSALSQTERERINSAIGNAVELLAPVAAICDIRRES
ncbi:EfeM/EfeO family lipoprotein [Subtercola vilae]|uniref:EfeM/EfeO family lipoprotein n=1 Tax=Subtercola vilae TaxID=2056433 RepID=UPI001F413B4E|nr:EfeM/EfeO family lipoprotein [Subtercola vilae]